MATKAEQPGEFRDLTKLVKSMSDTAQSFDEKKAAAEVWMKLEALKLKAKGRDFGQGFDKPGGDDDNDF